MSHQYRSSYRFSTLTPMTPEDYRKAKHIINHIIENPQSFQFRQPVNWEALGLADYLEIVQHPIDLGTVRNKLDSEEYSNVQEFLDDFQLIWDNCKNYNTKGTWIYGLADKLQKNGKKMLKNYFPQIPLQTIKTLQASQAPKVSSSQSKQKKSQTKIQSLDKLYYQDDQEITMKDKIKLADYFKSFSPPQNKLLVEYIQSVCPTAFRMVEENAQIVVDNIDIIAFKQVMQKAQEIEGQVEAGMIEGVKRVKFE